MMLYMVIAERIFLKVEMVMIPYIQGLEMTPISAVPAAIPLYLQVHSEMIF